MPIYEYQCAKCGTTFELIQKFSDAPLEVHEECGGALEKLVSASALQFKGSGWYINDYAKAGAKKPDADKGDAGKSANGESKSDAKSDTKTEAKTESKGETKSESKSDSTPAPAATSTKSD